MSSTGTQPSKDPNALLKAFLLNAYVATFYDQRRTPEESLSARMSFESFLLEGGPLMLERLQDAFDLGGVQPAVAEWFMTFASSLSEEWLKKVRYGPLERFWRDLRDH